MKLNDSVSVLKGVGTKKTEVFRKEGIITLEDLLRIYPRTFEDRRTVRKIESLKAGDTAMIEIAVMSSRAPSAAYRNKSPFILNVSDDTGKIEVVFFHSYYKTSSFPKGEHYTVSGKVTEGINGKLQMVHPEIHKTGSSDDVRGILPVYPLIEGITQKEMRKYQMQLVPLYKEAEEWIPEDIRTSHGLADIEYTLKNLHFPQRGRDYLAAKYRMIFDEFMTMETGLLLMSSKEKNFTEGTTFTNTDVTPFLDGLTFSLTEGQEKAWNDIEKDLSSSKSMNRLIQGDVGSGKTVIAEMAMYSAALNDYQSVMMVPTELLAKQHYLSLQKDFERHGVNIGMLCSSMKSADKRETLEKLEKGEINILVGTHAVIEPGVKFKNLGLVITDEQHRFGVNQRNLLNRKGNNPNIMVMTATPIPRTLAVILYGDSDISQIRTMPEGRKPVKTIAGNRKNRTAIYDAVRKELLQGHQAYVVAPLIEESEVIEAVSAEELYEELRKKYKEFNVALVHGAMKQEEKDDVMSRFAKGETDVLVSTVVIEVGINVPNATVMVIENCERFGLAQMHQLRGRVGRGKDQSYCYLITNKESQVSRKRCSILCNSSDGFEISEEDLKLRGPGEIFGTRQHGLPEMIFGDIIRHADILEKAKNTALEILEEDPYLGTEKYRAMKNKVVGMFGENITLNL